MHSIGRLYFTAIKRKILALQKDRLRFRLSNDISQCCLLPAAGTQLTKSDHSFQTQIHDQLQTSNLHGDSGIKSCMLVRDYIHDSLYHHDHGYFVRDHGSVVGEIPKPLNFSAIRGIQEYKMILYNVYKETNLSWYTPVEIFKPWYGYGIAEYILRMHKNSATSLKIYEIGGGSGTCALDVMAYIKQNAPSQIYDTMSYTSVEISPALAVRQLDRIHSEGSHVSKFRVLRGSASDISTWGGRKAEENCFIIMLEVLDNLPHDKVEREGSGEPWMETWVQECSKKNESLKESEVFPTEALNALQDPLIIRCMEVLGLLDSSQTRTPISGRFRPLTWLSSLMKRRHLEWLPTGALGLLETLHFVRPRMTLIAADFSSLPDVQLPGVRAPLVASKEGGVTVDHSTYLVPKGSADIFFPTDFDLLQLLDSHASKTSNKEESERRHAGLYASKLGKNAPKRLSAVLSTHEFMNRFADSAKTKTNSGYNPLFEDFSNTKFFLSISQH